MKKLGTLIAIIMLIVTLPVEASSLPSNQGVAVCTTGLGYLCHCGGERQVSDVETYESVYCSEHGATCTNYFYVTVKEYFSCSNPHCTDTWTSSVVKSAYYVHN